MWFLKRILKNVLRYQPLRSSEPARHLVGSARTQGRPYCPDSEGDLIHSLISTYQYRRCLETGFGTGSTAVYMLHAAEPFDGEIVSVDWNEININHLGRALLKRSNMASRHRLIEKDSNKVIPELYLAGERFDFIFIDGRRTFDQLLFELFMMNRMLNPGGAIVFDDSWLPSVQRAIRLLKRHYGYEEVDYRLHNHGWRLRVFQFLITASLRRPYRAFHKVLDVEDQAPTRDHYFYRRF